MSDHWQRIERGLRKILTIVPTIPLFKSQSQNNELSRVICLLGIAFIAFNFPIETILCVLATAWWLGREETT